jgi:hypothetical protein
MMTGLGLLFLVGALNTGAVQDDFTGFARKASEWLLAGQGLPGDYRVMLMQMSSADRIRSIAYLRRLGLLTGQPWSVDDILRPAATKAEPGR